MQQTTQQLANSLRPNNLSIGMRSACCEDSGVNGFWVEVGCNLIYVLPYCQCCVVGGFSTRETKLLRDTLERCEMCRTHKHCRDSPCYPGVQCADTSDGFRCGPCPRGYTGDGVSCKQVVTCNDRPCFEGVRCYDVDSSYRCGPCPPGYTGNGVTCKPANRCAENPCWSGVQCVNIETSPGYICGPCPTGFLWQWYRL
ncbi:thrombospondin-4 [Caerostris extrusa]|uniref:Thrombospondin-4 n=1 Tax=Caerostris extrusa TaxID=172846 RepID=A0AAV4XJ27_CAEEX|nr:thrombospondin-4 [Caerostris extrusa]